MSSNPNQFKSPGPN